MKKVHVVGAVIINDEGQILCAKRAANLTLGGFWEFPGGKIEPNESHQEALVREIYEEMGVNIEVGELVADIYHEYPTVIVHLITYYAKITAGTLQSTDHDELVWLHVEQLNRLEWAPADIPSVEKLMGNPSF